jgi:cytoskeletal protein RodZ
MTARQDARVGTRATSEDAWSFETQRAPDVGEILQTARERKGVDLARAERETKIRARHLMALESGDVSALPAPVYAKGFLRNYSTYLGLDADEMVSRWRKEIDQPRSADTPSVKPPPQPITTPSHGFKLTTGLVVAIVLAAIVLTFVGYVGLQLVRFTQNPDISLTGPAIRQLQPGAEFLRLRGASASDAEITATYADDQVRQATADERGQWSLSLPVNKGENHFTIIGTDPETARRSEPLKVIATVPILGTEVAPGDEGPALPEGVEDTNITGVPSADLTLTQPADGLRSDNGKVRVVGASDAEEVVVSFQWRGNLERAKQPPPATTLPVEDGVFRGAFQLPKGRWNVSVAAAIDGGAPAIEQVAVRSLNDRMVLKVEAVDGQTRVRISRPDGDVIDDRVLLKAGQKQTWRVDPDVLLRVGNARAAHVTVDGIDHGAVGNKAEAKTWRIKQGEKPKKVE